MIPTEALTKLTKKHKHKLEVMETGIDKFGEWNIIRCACGYVSGKRYPHLLNDIFFIPSKDGKAVRGEL